MIIHKELAAGRWFQFSFLDQMANVGTDIERTIQGKKAGNRDYSRQAFERALELLTLTIIDAKNAGARRKELCRTREALIDHFVYDNEYNTTDEQWSDYFYQFNYAAALARGK